MKLIEFSGVDGSGKTTALRAVADHLRAGGLRVLCTTEVGSPHVYAQSDEGSDEAYLPCYELKKITFSEKYQLSDLSRELIMYAMRVENHRMFAKLSDKYDVFLVDRGVLCHYAYGAEVLSSERITEILLSAKEYLLPVDGVVYFNVPDDEAELRRGDRGGDVDVIEAKGVDYLNRVNARYRQLTHDLYHHRSRSPLTMFIKRLETVDASMDKDTTAAGAIYCTEKILLQP